MSNKQQKHFIPYLRTFKIENIPRLKLSLVDEKSKYEINRILFPNVLPEKLLEVNQYPNKQQSIVNISSTSHVVTSSKMNMIDHQPTKIITYNHEEHLQSSSIVPIDSINEQYQLSSAKHINIPNSLSSSVQRVEPSLSPPLSQLIPDLIINDKQTTKRISNETNSTNLSKFITLTSMNSSEKKSLKSIENNSSSSNHIRYYQIGNIFTSTSTFLMHQNRVIAHATASNSFLSDTIFIILIATLTIIILLFCLGLFCLCRRTTKRNISPSFDGSSYAELNGGRSYEIPIDNYQQQKTKYENNIPLITDRQSSSIQIKSLTNPSLPTTNDNILLPQTVALHHTARQKIPINNKKLKKKRVGFCCCNSQRTPSTTVNARPRM